jgi:hypothetical protein
MSKSPAKNCGVGPTPEPSSSACQKPIPDCMNPNGQYQLGRNIVNDPPSLSEVSFEQRYQRSPPTQVVAPNHSPASGLQKGGRRKGKSRRKYSPFRFKRNSYRKPKSRAGSRKSYRKKSMIGGGYYLDLSTCPLGGLPSHVMYDDKHPPHFSNSKNGLVTPKSYDGSADVASSKFTGGKRKSYRRKSNRRKSHKK